MSGIYDKENMEALKSFYSQNDLPDEVGAGFPTTGLIEIMEKMDVSVSIDEIATMSEEAVNS